MSIVALKLIATLAVTSPLPHTRINSCINITNAFTYPGNYEAHVVM
jgi:hypothetical protein